MKIGTINFHRSQNYGALLVTYSLIAYLRKKGIEAHPIDYFPEHHTSMYPERNAPYDDFVDKYLRPFYSSDDEFDLIIYGADTIWERYKNYGYDDVYWGSEKLKSKRKITYSASGTMKNFSDESDDLFRNNLDNFSHISVREDVLADYLKKLTGKEIMHTCDPTFLLTENDYAEIMSERLIDGDYAVVYNRQLGTKLFDAAQTVQKKTSFQTVVIKGDGCLYDSNGQLLRNDIGPSEFLSLIKYSSYVLAASFHAVAFSVIFRKQFNTIMKSGSERVESLLRILELERRRIDHTREIDMSDKIDYSRIDGFNKYIENSKKWLLNAVNNSAFNDTYIWGAAKHGAAALEYCRDSFNVKGFIDQRSSKDFNEYCSLPVIYPDNELKFKNIIISVRYPIDVINTIKNNSINVQNIYIFDGRNPDNPFLYKVDDENICTKEYMDKRFSEYQEYSMHYSKINPYIQDMFYSALNYLSDKSCKICELCCGSGQMANILFDKGFYNYIGVDFSEEAIKLAKQANPQFSEKFLRCDAFEFLSENDLSDVKVFMIFEALEHLSRDVELLKLLPKGAEVIFSVPNFKSFNHVRTFDKITDIANRYENINIIDYKMLKANDKGCFFHLAHGIITL